MSTKSDSGFTLVEIMIVLCLIALLAIISIPNFVEARQAAQRTVCINNLRQIDGAKEIWALENKASTGAKPRPADLKPYIRGLGFPTCPGGGAYTVNPLRAAPRCSLGVKLGHVYFTKTNWKAP
ncbi:MAG: competence type IV pilus major pilin ComGC [Limisphaerales bacterium]